MKQKVFVIFAALLVTALIIIPAAGCGNGESDDRGNTASVNLVAQGEVQLEEVLRQQLTGSGLEIVDFSELDNQLILEFPSTGGAVTGHFTVSQAYSMFNPQEDEYADFNIIYEGDLTGTYSSSTTRTFVGTAEITLKGSTDSQESDPETHEWDWGGSLDKNGHMEGSIADIPFTAEVSET